LTEKYELQNKDLICKDTHMSTGIEYLKTIDLITYDPTQDEYVLIIAERVWGESGTEQELLLQKLNNYLHFVLDGQLERTHPQTSGKRIRIQIDCSTKLPSSIKKLINQAQELMAKHDIKVKINLLK